MYVVVLIMSTRFDFVLCVLIRTYTELLHHWLNDLMELNIVGISIVIIQHHEYKGVMEYKARPCRECDATCSPVEGSCAP